MSTKYFVLQLVNGHKISNESDNFGFYIFFQGEPLFGIRNFETQL